MEKKIKSKKRGPKAKPKGERLKTVETGIKQKTIATLGGYEATQELFRETAYKQEKKIIKQLSSK